ncbi:MAG: acetyltransferase [Gammaproteobacteria bacterium]|nr:acetyltransferase [Gammaproteobacteria bacterium]
MAAAVREACLTAARAGYERAAMAGLCHEGAMEVSLDAIRALDLDALLTAHAAHGKKP